MKARDFIAHRLMVVLPADTPASYREIISAEYRGKGCDRVATATLVMFDGLSATVEISTHGLMPQRFTSLPGGDLSYECGQWIRIDRVTLEPVDLLSKLQEPA